MSSKKKNKKQVTGAVKKQQELTKNARSAREIRESARKFVAESHELHRQSCEAFCKALDELCLLSTLVDGAPVLGEQKKQAAEKKAPVSSKTKKPGAKPAPASKPAPAKPATAGAKEPDLPQSVKIGDREMEIHLGSFGAKPLADRDAAELIGHPMVFWYRRGMFPDPRQSRVNPTVISATVVERKGKSFTAAPFTVHVKIGMAGDAARCRSWAKGVLARNKGDQE